MNEPRSTRTQREGEGKRRKKDIKEERKGRMGRKLTRKETEGKEDMYRIREMEGHGECRVGRER
jgi:hypothetical protein